MSLGLMATAANYLAIKRLGSTRETESRRDGEEIGVRIAVSRIFSGS